MSMTMTMTNSKIQIFDVLSDISPFSFQLGTQATQTAASSPSRLELRSFEVHIRQRFRTRRLSNLPAIEFWRGKSLITVPALLILQ